MITLERNSSSNARPYLRRGPPGRIAPLVGVATALLSATACDIASFERVREGLIVVHMEVGEENHVDTTSTAYQERYWPALVDLVDLADAYDVRLTLLFNPQWGEYIVPNEERLALVREWEERGHELGVHHHGLSYDIEWNGFSNEAQAKQEPGYRGDVADMMAFLDPMSGDGVMTTWAGSDADTDVPDGIDVIATGTGATGVLNSASTSQIDGSNYELLKYSPFIGLSTQEQVLQQLPQMLDGAARGAMFSTALHEADFDANRAATEQLFEILESAQVDVRTAQELGEEDAAL